MGIVGGNNYYRIDLSTIGDKYMMDVHVASGWKGTITYLDNCDYESEELLPADINGTGRDGLEAQRVIHAAIKSLDEGRIVEVAEI